MPRTVLFLSSLLAMIATSASAGSPIPLPGAGVAGPVALVAAIGAVAGARFLRSRRK